MAVTHFVVRSYLNGREIVFQTKDISSILIDRFYFTFYAISEKENIIGAITNDINASFSVFSTAIMTGILTVCSIYVATPYHLTLLGAFAIIGLTEACQWTIGRKI